MKKPLPISIDEELIKWIESKVDKNKFRNRSHLVEIAVIKFKENMEEEASSENKLREKLLKQILAKLGTDLDKKSELLSEIK